MTRTTKLSLIGVSALLAGTALMLTLHRLAMPSLDAGSAGAVWMHHGMRVPHEMPWLMPLGPLAMALAFAGVGFLAASLVRLASRNG